MSKKITWVQRRGQIKHLLYELYLKGRIDRATFYEQIADLNKVATIKHGRWIEDEYGIPHCSECKAINNTVYRNYCPNCGARMDAKIGEDKSHPFAESVMMGMDEDDL